MRPLVSPIVRREYAFVVKTMFATYWVVIIVGVVVYLVVGVTNS